MRDHHKSIVRIGAIFIYYRTHQRALPLIQTVHRLVENQQVGVGDEGLGESCLLALSAGELVDVFENVVNAEFGEYLFDSVLVVPGIQTVDFEYGAVHALLRNLVGQALFEEGDAGFIFFDGAHDGCFLIEEGVEHGVLFVEAVHLGQIGDDDVVADNDLSLVGHFAAGNNIEKRALARAVAGNERALLSLFKPEGDLLEQDIIEGNIIQMADKVMEVLRFKYLHAPIHFEGMQRIETLEIPDKAFREILYNAIAHKLYSGASIQMHVYDDRIEVWNEGQLPEGYTPETLLRRHSSRPRNKNIAFAFFKAGFIDRWGLGYKKIMEGFKEAGMKLPTVEQIDGGVRVTVWRQNVTSDVTSNVTSDVTSDVVSLSQVQLTDRQKKILEMIKLDATVSANRMSEELSVVMRTIRRDLSKLQEMGLVAHEGNTSAGRWVILQNNFTQNNEK